MSSLAGHGPGTKLRYQHGNDNGVRPQARRNTIQRAPRVASGSESNQVTGSHASKSEVYWEALIEGGVQYGLFLFPLNMHLLC